MSARDPLENVPPELLDWHKGALAGDPVVCAAPQPGRPDFPCIQNQAFHALHSDVLGRSWPGGEERLRVAARTVTVETLDHGPVVLEEPSWCVIAHPDGNHRSGIRHDGVEHAASVDVPGRGRVEFLKANLTQFPFAESGSRDVKVVVEIDGEHPEFDPAGLGDLAAAITAHALYGLLPLKARLQSLGEQ